MEMCCNCVMQYLRGIAQVLTNGFSSITCAIHGIVNSVGQISNESGAIYATLASQYPMAVAAEYPTQGTDKIVYSTTKVRFLDMLNPKMVVLFKGVINAHKPVYFKDTSGYEHIVASGSTSTQVMGNQLINNHPYKALYIGNYVILNPSDDTMEEFETRLLDLS